MTNYTKVVSNLVGGGSETTGTKRSCLMNFIIVCVAVGVLVGLCYLISAVLPSGGVIDPDPAPTQVVIVVPSDPTVPVDYSSISTGLLFRTNFGSTVQRALTGQTVGSYTQFAATGIDLKRDESPMSLAFGPGCLRPDTLNLPAPRPFSIPVGG
jgi:hypothetical protein